jgi:hypothetical protein
MEPKGYSIGYGYMGWIGDGYMLFASEEDYLDWLERN